MVMTMLLLTMMMRRRRMMMMMMSTADGGAGPGPPDRPVVGPSGLGPLAGATAAWDRCGGGGGGG
jgi:hypothetical protein